LNGTIKFSTTRKILASSRLVKKGIPAARQQFCARGTISLTARPSSLKGTLRM